MLSFWAQGHADVRGGGMPREGREAVRPLMPLPAPLPLAAVDKAICSTYKGFLAGCQV